ncbi:MAG: oxidoreductase [Lentisphaerae bacterium RIFOXYB12_FULL_65_16]|nr:MAG: oxidoreductase [Lentisphaerae bacterium RIFOXYA12_64_32]OGV85506.1 MAG: oxidoreductase [Lentisphaerae bacterium RIFOXYB12_FULL_65_16]
MKQVFIKQGQAVVEEIPAPQVQPGTVLVRVEHSCISVGTELSGVTASGVPLWQRALTEPANVKKAVEMALTQGPTRTYDLISGQLAAGTPTGYSAAGIAIAVGSGVADLRPGDRVACAGAQCAHHAEVICVPRNLAVPVPPGLDLSLASTVTLGAIALQGVRRATPTLGETFAVIGLGLLGQLAAQMLKANGCHVLGVDLNRKRLATALDLGLDAGLHPEDHDPVEQALRLTGGIGVDGVVVTAATADSAVLATAFRMCRRKGRVVVVGDVGMNIERADMYAKELDLLMSTSYGPGRYDRHYEEEGQDYPVGYVRWTENRNMAEYLRLLKTGQVRIQPLVDATYPVDETPAAYARLNSGDERPLAVLLRYPQAGNDTKPADRVMNPAAKPLAAGQVRIAIAGAGQFARAVHLPNLARLHTQYHLQAVMSRTGHHAQAAATQFQADYSTTDYERLLADPAVDAVLICTRHNLHAGMALQALRAGKHVLVEKPLALTRDELAAIQALFAEAQGQTAPILLAGFNRRFSPYARRLRELTRGRSNPMILNYRMNAGYIPPDHWVHSAEGGGRNLGEACHVYDLFTYLTDARVAQVHAAGIGPGTGHYRRNDNFIATLTFDDGSVATLTYTALGTQKYAKELLEIYVDGQVLALDDYRSLTVAGSKARGIKTRTPEKGHTEELEAFAAAVTNGGAWPIPLWQQAQATEIALKVEACLG